MAVTDFSLVVNSGRALSDTGSGTGTQISTDAVKLGKFTNAAGVAQPTPDIAIGEPIGAVFHIRGANAAGGTSIDFQVISATDAAGTGATVLASTGAVALASLTQNARFVLYVPVDKIPSNATHIMTQAVRVGTFTGTTSLSTSYFTPLSMIQNDKYYSSGFSVAE